jgi:CHRD domain-containing protein
MLRRLIKASIPLLAVFGTASAFADTFFTADINTSQEVPPTNPTTSAGAPRLSSGTATFDLNDAQTSMTMVAVVTGIDVTGSQSPDANDNLVAAHIHAGANGPGGNNSVVWGFFGSPFNDNNPNDFVLTPFPAGQVGGTFTGKWDAPEGNSTTLAAQIPNILAGHSYINFHTTQFGTGEIRGFLTQVPEPSAIALLATMATTLMATRRRKQR